MWKEVYIFYIGWTGGKYIISGGKELAIILNYTDIKKGVIYMGEAIIARGQTASKNVLDNVPVVQGVCSILVKVTDSSGEIIPNCPVWCKDGSKTYNYNTNAEGYTLFQCNSGAANITAQNFSILDKYNMVDQLPATTNEDAPIGTKKLIAMVLKNRVGNEVYITSNIPNGRFMDTASVSRVITIGGGAAGQHGSGTLYGGGGGAFNEAYNVKIDRSSMYNFTIGRGGSNGNGQAGGTTSALGISSVGGSGNKGGGSGIYKGGDGADWPTWHNSYYNTDYFYNQDQMQYNYPINFISNYFKADNSNKYKNFGHGGAPGTSDSLWCWYGWEKLIANGGHLYAASGSGIDTHWAGTQGKSASIYGSGGGGGGRSSAGWGNGSGGAGKQGVIILQF